MSYFGLVNVEIDVQGPITMDDKEGAKKYREIKALIEKDLKAVVDRIKTVLPDGRVFLNFHK